MKTLLIISCACLLSGCAGMKSSFDCNATAQDSCMTMEEANQKAQGMPPAAQTGKKPAPALPDALPAQPVPVKLPEQRSPAAGQPLRPVTPRPGSGLLSPRSAPVMTTAAAPGHPAALQPVSHAAVRPVSRPDPSAGLNDTGITQAVYQPAPTARVWIAGWIDDHDNFFQPAVVSFVIKQGQWAEYQ